MREKSYENYVKMLGDKSVFFMTVRNLNCLCVHLVSMIRRQKQLQPFERHQKKRSLDDIQCGIFSIFRAIFYEKHKQLSVRVLL